MQSKRSFCFATKFYGSEFSHQILLKTLFDMFIITNYKTILIIFNENSIYEPNNS